eukprot:TRINITY_DN10385_c0_g1_i1.p1 TRINITY_DN10385_c0_g1~~TRINITY_DN10385_c0_g1_i1.p1  ORF type:complete len:494 (+),score=106.80 TRINITY_DN10385_c0_g1_i1:228-1709(+)
MYFEEIQNLVWGGFDTASRAMHGSGRFFRSMVYGAKITKVYHDCPSQSAFENEQEYKRVRGETHQKAANLFLELFQKNGGIFIKAGQHMSSLVYILPEQYTKTMSVLLDQAPHYEFSEIKDVVEQDLRKPIDQVFKIFDETPIAAGSLAQVHRAVLHNGMEVAVKIQYPHLRRDCSADLMTIRFLVFAAKKLFPEFELEWLAKEFELNLPNELNFIEEAKNAQKIARLFSSEKWVKVPDIIWNLTTERVLTMEFVKGCKVTDVQGLLDNGISPKEVASRITRLYSKKIYIFGFVHSDPHPGNVLVRRLDGTDEPQIVLLDHGLYTTLREDFRVNYCHLWKAIIDMDESALMKYATLIGGAGTYKMIATILTARPYQSLQGKWEASDISAEEKALLQKHAQEQMEAISQLLGTIPREMLLLLKTNDLLRCINKSLGTPANGSVEILGEYCIKGLYVSRDVDTFALHQTKSWTRTFQLVKWHLKMWIYSFFGNSK